MKAVLNECLRPRMDDPDTALEEGETAKRLNSIFSHVQEGLGYQYHNAWAQVLHLMSCVLDVCGARCSSHLGKLFLPQLAERRDADAGDAFALKNELDYVVGKAVRRMGPRKVSCEFHSFKLFPTWQVSKSQLFPF